MLDARELPDLSEVFAPPNVGLMPGWYYQTMPTSGLSTLNTLGNGNLRVTPFAVPRKVRLSRIGAEVTAEGDVGSEIRLGIYADNGFGYPGALVVDAGVLAGDVAGVSELMISTVLKPGLYWVGGAVQGVTSTQPTVRTPLTTGSSYIALSNGSMPAPGYPSAMVIGYNAFGVTGALPTQFQAAPYPTGAAVRVFVKVA